jgi:hypothetical protein
LSYLSDSIRVSKPSDNPEAPVTGLGSSMVDGPCTAKLASGRSPSWGLLDEQFAVGLRGVQRYGRTAHQLIGVSKTASLHWEILVDLRGDRGVFQGLAELLGAVGSHGGPTLAGEGAGASRQLTPAGGGAAACAAEDVVPTEGVLATTRTAMEPPQ